MISVRKLRLHNFGPFRGVHEIELKDLVYGVIARHENDADRSNHLGKTTLLKVPGFAFYGNHWARFEDGWISEGESEGGVHLWMSDGYEIERTRKRGKSTQLRVVKPGGMAGFGGDAAQESIEALLGLTKADYRASCYFEQKRMSHFVICDPSDRMKIVGGWFALDKLTGCEKSASARMSRAMDVEQKVVARIQAIEAVDYGEQKDKEAVALRVSELAMKVEQLEEKITERAAWRRDAEHAARYDEVEREGLELKGKAHDQKALAEQRKKTDAALEKAREAERTARRDKARVEELVSGEFDGTCPVDCRDCPVTADINKKGKKRRDEAEAAVKVWQAAKKKLDEAVKADEDCGDTQLEAERQQERLGYLRSEIRRLKPLVEQVKDRGDIPDTDEEQEELDQLRNELANERAALSVIETVAAQQKKNAEELEKLRDLASRASASAMTSREGARVFRAAKRRVAEGALGAIEAGANALLADSEIDLVLRVAWAREGDGLASECEDCGAAFPSSAKVKECQRCGAQRGQKMIQRLDLDIDKRSGATEDLAGGAFQLAASAWLRGARHAQLATALLDEPYGSLDKRWRGAFARHMAVGLSRLGFVQALVVAHQRETIDALPGRIEIISDGRWSKVERVVG